VLLHIRLLDSANAFPAADRASENTQLFKVEAMRAANSDVISMILSDSSMMSMNFSDFSLIVCNFP